MNTSAAETQAIETVIREYFQGYTQAQGELVARAFHPDTRLLSVDEGKLDRTEMPAWLDNLRARREKGDIRQADLRIAFIDITSDAAVAKAVLTFQKLRFTDYLSLLRVEGSWKIVGKIYQMQEP